MVIDTERVRRHIQAALASLPLLACAAPPPDADTTQRTAPPAAAMAPIESAPVTPPTPSAVPTGAVPLEPEEDARRRREVRHAEILKNPPRAVSGRPLRVDGRDVVALLRRVDAAGGDEELGRDLSPELRARIAAEWMRDARHEHASIASFERAHAELAVQGAPEALLERTRRAASEEAVHASLCLAMAWRYGAPPLAPGPLETPPPRWQTLAELAADVFEEGVVNESFAATVAASGARRCEVADARALLDRIARDESAHAALAWATVRWALSVDPTAHDAVARRAASLRPGPTAAAPEGALAAHGRLDEGDLARAWAQTWQDLVDPWLDEALAA